MSADLSNEEKDDAGEGDDGGKDEGDWPGFFEGGFSRVEGSFGLGGLAAGAGVRDFVLEVFGGFGGWIGLFGGGFVV